MKKPCILSFGEILWDVFPDAKYLGGAPLNFAAHFTKLGGVAYMVSALGTDALGERAREGLKKLYLPDDFVVFTSLETGSVQIALDDHGVPSYTMAEPVSYDDIHTDKAVQALEKGGIAALYYGTLAQRREPSHAQLQRLLQLDCPVVLCDVNIRGDFITRELLEESVSHATIVKISQEEWPIFDALDITHVRAEEPDASKQIETLCRQLQARYPKLQLVLITLGKNGAMAYDCVKETFTYGPKPTSPVVSTVGAGDSFSAAFLYTYLAGGTVEACLENAVLLSDYVVSQPDAVPDYPKELQAKLAVKDAGASPAASMHA